MDVLYLADQGSPAFEADRLAVDVVCAGDSITGWNDVGPAHTWPYPTYPDYLQRLCRPLGLSLGLRIANAGIAGGFSDNGPKQVADYLDLFPIARYFIMGMGTNDFGTSPDTAETSRRIIANLGRMVQAVQDRGKRAILFNVPDANEELFPSNFARELNAKRDYHNRRLKEFCSEKRIPLADICSRLGDAHFADLLHPNEQGAKIIAKAVLAVLVNM
jgi:lysophospholipase L1-like esterase